jgi:5-methyltetrahydrofolate--homocysteine methyltransferase
MQHYLVWKLIDPTRAGIGLTSAGQITPEYSTAAIVVHHPDAEYFIL